MITNKQIAEAIFPNITLTIEDLEKKYPLRNLPKGAEVTRFAPSPTGFLHTGSLFTSMVCRKVASQTQGIFYVRLEDTDVKREVAGAGQQLLEQLRVFNVVPDEGYLGEKEKGSYGPYIQSERAEIYSIAVKHLLEIGLAYPCFCSEEDVENLRLEQEKLKCNPGYYGEFAKCRNLSNEEKYQKIKNGEKFIVRFRSGGNHEKKIKVIDLIRGEFEIAENDQDIVIYKSDGLPTYHFAHVVDDHFMRTTTVIRGEEWIASLPIHVQIFDAIGWKKPNYAHLPLIMKLDENGNKRKLSKRLDSEAAVSYFIENGYPPEALTMYLMTIVNSNFEEWILSHRFEKMEDFVFSFKKMSLDGALFDMGKVNFFARELLAKLNKDEITALAKKYADKYNPDLAKVINDNPSYFTNIMNIDREKANPRKDFERFGNMLDIIGFFYQDLYEKEVAEGLEFNPKFSNEDLINALITIKEQLSFDHEDEQSWFNNLKEIGAELGYATSNKDYKANPTLYKGNMSDLAEILRIALTSRKNAPNLYSVMQVLGKEESIRRIDYICSLLKK
ncbi:MAG TPA: glutamate--tRNA ligase [Erysipelotrichaceae bacterium]|nr:glutamate--tRNA ligase [Erysipelotrichaceae bacterium]